MKSCLNLFYCFALLLLSVVCSPAPTVNFSSPPFSATDFNVDQPHNFIGLRGSSNTVPVGIYPIKITFLTGSNYFSIDATGIPNNFVLTASNNIATWQTNSGSGGGSSSTLTNVVYTNAGPSDTYVLNGTSYLKTNSFSGSGGGSNLLYNFNTNDFTATLVTNISLSLNVPRTNRNNTFYGTQTFADILANTLNTSAGAMIGTDLSWGGMGSGDGSGIVNLNATFLTSGTVGTARLGTGAANSGTYLRGDGSWQPVSGGLGGTLTNVLYTNAGPADTYVVGPTAYLKTNNFSGGSGGLPTLGGNGTNETFWGLTQLTNSTSGNGVSFDGTSLLLDGVNLNTGIGGTIGGVGSGLVALNGSGISSGTVGIAFLPSTVLTNLVPTNALVPSVSGHTGFVPTNSMSGGGGGFSNQLNGVLMRGILTKVLNISTGNGNGMSAGDLNGDGLPDLAVDANAALVIYTNAGNGTSFVQASTTAITSVSGGNAIADVNGDGRNDVIIASSSGNYVAVFTNNRSGTMVQKGSNYSYTSPSVISVAFLNGDSSPDFIVSCGTTSSTVAVYTNDSTGIFAISTNFPAFLNTSAIATGDFNGDGSTDVAFSPTVAFAASTFGTIIMTNNGAGVFGFWRTNVTPSTTIAVYAVTAGDFNNDGKIDLAMEFPSAAGSILAYTNNGNGFGLFSSNLFAVTTSAGGMSVGDFNADGKQDILATSVSTYSTTLFTNSGIGFFPSITNIQSTLTAPQFPAATDFNGDGFPDYAVYQTSSSGGVAVYLNLFNVYGNFIGNGAGVTNLPISVSFSSSVLTPAASVTTNLTGTVINIATNYLSYSAAKNSVANGTVMTANTTSTVTYNTVGNSENVYNTSASTLTTLSLTLPSTGVIAGQQVTYSTHGIVTTLTVTGTVTIGSVITTLIADQTISYRAITTGSWIRIQ